MTRPGHISRRTFLKGAALTGAVTALPQLLTGCSGSVAETEPTLQQKIAQMLMIGFPGTLLESTLTRDLVDYGIGGVVLYERNIASPAQLMELTAKLQAYAPLPLLIAVDQEGGNVARLQEGNGFPPSVSARFLGKLNDPVITRHYADSIAATLKNNGLNVNLAPVVDLDINPDSPAIGSLGRSFSADPAIVLNHARIFAETHASRGVVTCCKHFPGHGSAMGDSHLGFVDVTDSWSETELEPYRLLIAAGICPMVMTAHIFNRHLDDRYPATLSHQTITGILRHRFNFDGVVVSDDLQMGAIIQEYRQETAVEMAILAGVDMLMFATSNFFDGEIVPRTVALVSHLVEQGALPLARINESYRRICTLKRQIRLNFD
jgi:beta-N-acetylhexosaminidase